MKKLIKSEQTQAFAFIAYLHTYERNELLRTLNLGTPSDKLVKLASEGTPNGVKFPRSLSTRSGQNLFFKFLKYGKTFWQNIPSLCFLTLNEVRRIADQERLASSREVMYRFGEAFLGFASAQFTTSIIFSFRMIREWLFDRYGKEYSNKQIQRALDFWTKTDLFEVTKGSQNNYGDSTKIRISFAVAIAEVKELTQDFKLSIPADLLAATDEWSLEIASANTTVFMAIKMVQADTTGFRGHWVRANQTVDVKAEMGRTTAEPVGCNQVSNLDISDGDSIIEPTIEQYMRALELQAESFNREVRERLEVVESERDQYART